MIELYSMIIAVQLIASGTHIIAKEAVGEIAPAELLVLRTLLASIGFFMLIAFRRKSLRIHRGVARRDIWKILLLGLLSVPLNQFFYLYGLKYSTSANSALLFATTPMFASILSAFFFAEKISSRKVIGILIAFGGVLPIVFEHGASLSSDFTFGNILLLVSVLAWAAYTVFGKELVSKYGALRVTGLSMITGTLEYSLIYFLTGEYTITLHHSYAAWAGTLYLALFASIIAYVLWYRVLSRMDVSKATVFQNLQPIFTPILVFLIFGTVVTPLFLACGAVTLAGVALTQWV